MPLNKLPIFPAGQYPIHTLRVGSQPDSPKEIPRTWQATIVIAGSGIHNIGRTSYPIRSGDIYLVNDRSRSGYSQTKGLSLLRILFAYEGLGMEKWETFSLPAFRDFFRTKAIDSYAQAIKTRLYLDKSTFRNCVALFEEMERSLKTRPTCWQTLLDCHFRHFVVLLSTAYGGGLRNHDEAAVRMKDIISVLEKRSSEPIDIDGLARASGMSRRSFYRLFRRATGLSPLKYQIHHRIQRACELLRNTDQPATLIAFASGFSDSNYFAREFRKFIGEPPTAYRKRWAN